MRRSAVWLAVAVGLGLAGCEAGPYTLVLDLRTDFAPGREFDRIEVVFEGEAPVTLEPDVAADYVMGSRLLERDDLSPTTQRIDVRLLRSGSEVVARPVLVTLDRDRAVTVVLTRRCRGVTCPSEGGDPEAIACQDGACVLPECTPENPCMSEVPTCTMDADCSASAACAQARCVAGSCLVTDGGSCGEDRFCDVSYGCRDVGRARPRWPLASGPDGFYLVASFDGTVFLGGERFEAMGGWDFVVRAFAPDGVTPRWTRQLGGAGATHVDAAVTDAAGRLAIAGTVGDPMLFADDGVTLDDTLDGDDYFIAVLDPSDGVAVWARAFVGPSSATTGGWTVFDASGGPLVGDGAGGLYAVVPLPEGGVVTGGEMITAPSGRGAALLALDETGEIRWSYALDGEVQVAGMAASGTGIALAGSFRGTADLGAGAVNAAGERDGFVLVLDDAGASASLRWADVVTHPDQAWGGDVALDGAGNLVLVGTWVPTAPLDLGGGPLEGLGGQMMFVAGYAPDGALRWSRAIGDTIGDFAIALRHDPNRDLFYLGGHLHNTVPVDSVLVGAENDVTGFWLGFDVDGVGASTGPMPRGGDVRGEWITWSQAVSDDGATVCAVGEAAKGYEGYDHRGANLTVYYDCADL